MKSSKKDSIGEVIQWEKKYEELSKRADSTAQQLAECKEKLFHYNVRNTNKSSLRMLKE